MKKILFLMLLSMVLFSCSSSNDDEKTAKNNLTVELSDIKGTWYVTQSTAANWKGIVMVLNDRQDCGWIQRDGDYVGPYYFLENVNDNTLKEQCGLLGANDANKIHIRKIHISKYASEESNYKDVYKSVLNINCDLRTYLPSKNSEIYIDNKIDHEAWSFWVDAEFSYSFEIIKYTSAQMVLKVVDSDFLYSDYESKYPMRIQNGTELTLERPVKD